MRTLINFEFSKATAAKPKTKRYIYIYIRYMMACHRGKVCTGHYDPENTVFDPQQYIVVSFLSASSSQFPALVGLEIMKLRKQRTYAEGQ